MVSISFRDPLEINQTVLNSLQPSQRSGKPYGMEGFELERRLH
jgi:hypothetical protein